MAVHGHPVPAVTENAAPVVSPLDMHRPMDQAQLRRRFARSEWDCERGPPSLRT